MRRNEILQSQLTELERNQKALIEQAIAEKESASSSSPSISSLLDKSISISENSRTSSFSMEHSRLLRENADLKVKLFKLDACLKQTLKNNLIEKRRVAAETMVTAINGWTKEKELFVIDQIALKEKVIALEQVCENAAVHEAKIEKANDNFARSVDEFATKSESFKAENEKLETKRKSLDEERSKIKATLVNLKEENDKIEEFKKELSSKNESLVAQLQLFEKEKMSFRSEIEELRKEKVLFLTRVKESDKMKKVVEEAISGLTLKSAVKVFRKMNFELLKAELEKDIEENNRTFHLSKGEWQEVEKSEVILKKGDLFIKSLEEEMRKFGGDFNFLAVFENFYQNIDEAFYEIEQHAEGPVKGTLEVLRKRIEENKVLGEKEVRKTFKVLYKLLTIV